MKKASRSTSAKDTALEAQMYSMKGEKLSTVTLPAKIFNVQWRSDLVHQVKPWKQKGTGQARHGSSRSPIWRHGGITFGPRSERNYSEKINKKMRIGALTSVLSKKAKDGEIILVDTFSFAAPKTAEALGALVAISKTAKARLLRANGSHSALVALATYDQNAIRSFRNLQGVATEEIRSLNPVEVLSHKYLIIENPEVAFAALLARVKSS